MSVILKNVTNSIWHAFSALRQGNSETVHKSKLKVLTANIGILLDLYGVERGLDHYRSTSELSFQHFQYYLQQEVFSQLSEKLNLSEQRNFEGKIEEVCWLICRKYYLQREKPIFPKASVYQLFRIFCLLGDLVPDKENDGNFQVIIEPSEAGLVAEQLVSSLGLVWNTDEWETFCGSVEDFQLKTFISVLETKYCGDGSMDEAPIVEAVDEIYQTFIKDVIKKGYLFKRGYLLPTLREYWFVLQPCELTYFKSPSEKMLCGSIALTPNCLLEPVAGTTKPLKLHLSTTERTFELATQDYKSRLQWLSALQLAIDHSCGKQGYQREQKEKRCKEKRRKGDYIHEMQMTKKLLQQEVKARVLAETQAHELALITKEDSKRILKMQNAQCELERLLAEETQAKHDEEIVRALQARVLTEEWDKREELERLQEEQREMLATEKLKRKQFEEIQKAKEIQLKEAEYRLKQLEIEKQRLDNELKIACNKIKLSENSKQILEEHLMVLSPNKKETDGVRRAFSFMPTTNNNNAPLLQARAATLKRHSKKEKEMSSNDSRTDT